MILQNAKAKSLTMTLTTIERYRIVTRIRLWLFFFMAALILSGLTAVPLVWASQEMVYWLGPGTAAGWQWPEMSIWVVKIAEGVEVTNRDYPFMLYGTDWLAFAHVVIAIGFIGPMRDPVRHRWYIDFGLICCVLILPAALIWGSFRSIPFFWRLIDCSFGVFGAIPLLIVRRYIDRLEQAS